MEGSYLDSDSWASTNIDWATMLPGWAIVGGGFTTNCRLMEAFVAMDHMNVVGRNCFLDGLISCSC